MLTPPLTKPERDHLLRRIRWLLQESRKAMLQDADDLSDKLDQEVEAARAEYFDRLPVVAMATCPHCDAPYLRSFDPFDVDGLWWEAATRRPGPTPCPHFALLRGAVYYGDAEPEGPPQGSHPGPEAPYVIPRILQRDGVVAVIGELPMEAGYRAYPIVYFGQPRPPIKALTAEWCDEQYTYTDELGTVGFVYPVDPWDFDLDPWIAGGKLRWCDPVSANEALAIGNAEDCPYRGLPGRREQIELTEGGLTTRALPDGEAIGLG